MYEYTCIQVCVYIVQLLFFILVHDYYYEILKQPKCCNWNIVTQNDNECATPTCFKVQ